MSFERLRTQKVEAFAEDVASITVKCSKGTYIRTLAEDIGSFLGCGAHLIGLRRSKTAGYRIENAITIEQLEAMTLGQRDQQLLPVESTIEKLPQVYLHEDAAYYLMQGQAVWIAGKVPEGELRLYNEKQKFLGLGYLQDDGKVAPKRLIRLNNN